MPNESTTLSFKSLIYVLLVKQNNSGDFLGPWFAEMLKSFLTNCVWRNRTPGKDQNSNYLELYKVRNGIELKAMCVSFVKLIHSPREIL